MHQRAKFVHTHAHLAHLHLIGDPGTWNLKEWPLPLKPLSALEVTLNSLRFLSTSEISERPGTCRCERYLKGERNWDLVLPQTLCWAMNTGDRNRMDTEFGGVKIVKSEIVKSWRNPKRQGVGDYWERHGVCYSSGRTKSWFTSRKERQRKLRNRWQQAIDMKTKNKKELTKR
mgnify:FL=1